MVVIIKTLINVEILVIVIDYFSILPLEMQTAASIYNITHSKLNSLMIFVNIL